VQGETAKDLSKVGAVPPAYQGYRALMNDPNYLYSMGMVTATDLFLGNTELCGDSRSWVLMRRGSVAHGLSAPAPCTRHTEIT
jgi:hypothetical protein